VCAATSAKHSDSAVLAEHVRRTRARSSLTRPSGVFAIRSLWARLASILLVCVPYAFYVQSLAIKAHARLAKSRDGIDSLNAVHHRLFAQHVSFPLHFVVVVIVVGTAVLAADLLRALILRLWPQ
jgi:hypothetical protein